MDSYSSIQVADKEKVQTKAQVFSRIKKHQKELKRLGVQTCGLFGSFVRETSIKDDSDVDILVTFSPTKKTFGNFMDLAFFLEEIFGRKVDLVTVQSLSPHIGSHILKEVEYVSTDS